MVWNIYLRLISFQHHNTAIFGIFVVYLTSKKTCSLFAVSLQQLLRVYDSKVPSDTKCKPFVDIRWLNWTITSSLFTILNHPDHPKGRLKNYALPIRKVIHILDTSWNPIWWCHVSYPQQKWKNHFPVPPTYTFFNMGIFQIFGWKSIKII